MTIKEVFPNPTVKLVAFELKFPNLFYLESKVGDYQVKIMTDFPESSLLLRQQLTFTNVGPQGRLEQPDELLDKEWSRKVWHFKSPKDFELELTTDSLVLKSAHHKTYYLKGGDKFRDIIATAVNSFLEVTALPKINRIGLRYIDECPLPSKDNSTFKSYYNSVFPVDRFNLEGAKEMAFQTVVASGAHFLRYAEALKLVAENQYVLVLDFDGFSQNVEPQNYLAVADELHTLISNEYEKTIREPVKKFMRKRKVKEVIAAPVKPVMRKPKEK